ncbi:hypothetical protein K443DRAFT_683440 [Laccaria amethystina LaAM-08-1]|uniref:Uncharacterized protein n=1 Tax=Laccaria amethystina LaAM-08-1 TaxID=1095629 RepID=A0A0C9WSU7_9AGAR|nr:hypothetical protein K443DRAFT_683440 [Laccaria amethystina LaAM-08-1]
MESSLFSKLMEPSCRIRVNEVSLCLTKGIRDSRRVPSVNLPENLVLRRALNTLPVIKIQAIRERHPVIK